MHWMKYMPMDYDPAEVDISNKQLQSTNQQPTNCFSRIVKSAMTNK